MIKELKELNFNKLLILDTDVSNYNIDEYFNNGSHKIKGYCTFCEQNGINLCPSDNNYKLLGISHGSMSEDYIMALNKNDINTDNWKTDNILFIMESPGMLYDWNVEKEYNSVKKYPTIEWYWIHNRQDKYVYPDYFKGGEYGNLFNSIIFTFELRNAYLTNFVKCGLNDKEGNYKGLYEYHPDCIKHCFNEFLLREIEILKPKIVFCFGSKPEDLLWNNYPTDYPFHVVGLPHPARLQQGFKNEFFRHLFFNMILESLYKTGIYSLDETIEKYKMFLGKIL